MKYLLLLPLPLLSLVGCSTPSTRIATAVPVQESNVAGTALDPQDTENVRYDESLKAYPVGRYQDPNNPYVMHEAHTIYRAEQPPAWNLNPNQPTAVPLGPTVAVADTAKQTTVMSGELEQKIAQQNQLLQATAEQNDQLAQELQTLKAEADKAHDAVEANAALQQQVADQQAAIQKLQQQAAARADDSSLSNPPKAPAKSWWSWGH